MEFEKAIKTYTCTAGYLYSMWHLELGMWISSELLVNCPESLETVSPYEIVHSVCSTIIVVICLWDRENMGHADLYLRVSAAVLRAKRMTSYTVYGSVKPRSLQGSDFQSFRWTTYVTHYNFIKCPVLASEMTFDHKQCVWGKHLIIIDHSESSIIKHTASISYLNKTN